MKPAARVTDDHKCPSVSLLPHFGGPILPPCLPAVTIKGKAVARLGDRLSCFGAIDTITEGATTVLIGGKPVARKGDRCVEGQITAGEATVLIGGPTGKQDVSQILALYQVTSEAKVSWEPSGTLLDIAVGLHLAERPPPQDLPITEARMLDNLGGLQQKTFKDIADEAFSVSASDQHYPSPPADHVPPNGLTNNPMWRNNDGHRDAFRHAYWNARLTQEYGEEWTRQYTTAHEASATNAAVREAMDLYNNEVGRNIAAHNPGASPDDLAALIQKAVQNGDTLVIDRHGNLSWSDAVPLWEHGETPGTVGIGGQPVPAGDASAR